MLDEIVPLQSMHKSDNATKISPQNTQENGKWQASPLQTVIKQSTDLSNFKDALKKKLTEVSSSQSDGPFKRTACVHKKRSTAVAAEPGIQYVVLLLVPAELPHAYIAGFGRAVFVD